VNIKIRDFEIDLLPAVRITLGTVSFILGVIGAILPVMQGWIFFLISAALFFPRHRFVHRILKKGERRVPRFVRWLRRLGVGHPYPQPEPVVQRIDSSGL
jgi:uncharacterized membrane protein YbaN (DUF454 family)